MREKGSRIGKRDGRLGDERVDGMLVGGDWRKKKGREKVLKKK